MSFSKDMQFKITAKDATTVTLEPVTTPAETPGPTSIVLTFAAAPAALVVNTNVSLRIRSNV